MRVVSLVLYVLVLSACSSSPPARQTPTPEASRAPATIPIQRARTPAGDFKPGEVREATVVLRFEFAGGTFDVDERKALPALYEGALLDGLNAKAVLARDIRAIGRGERFDRTAALTRAREVGAVHVMLVDVKIERGEIPFCARSRQPFRATTTRWTQVLEIIRVSDDATRFTIPNPGIQVTELAPDCEAPKKSAKRSRDETLTEGVEALLKRAVGP